MHVYCSTVHNSQDLDTTSPKTDEWREDIRKRCRRVNMIKCYVVMFENIKMKPIVTILRMSGGRMRQKDGGAESN
jgi:hypothetical protein